MCKIICNNGECKYCSPTWYCVLESIEISEEGICTCYAEFEDTDYVPIEEIEATMKGEIEL